MQSHKATESKPRLPWGFGSAARHGRVWWFIYRNTAGEMQYENSGTGDVAEAQKLLAQRAIPRARNMLEALERIADGEPYQPATEAGRRSSKPRTRSDGRAARNSRPRSNRKVAQKAARISRTNPRPAG